MGIKMTIPAARKNKNLTQKELAVKCGVSLSTIYSWESGKTEPTISQAFDLADILGIGINDIIFLH